MHKEEIVKPTRNQTVNDFYQQRKKSLQVGVIIKRVIMANISGTDSNNSGNNSSSDSNNSSSDSKSDGDSESDYNNGYQQW